MAKDEFPFIQLDTEVMRFRRNKGKDYTLPAAIAIVAILALIGSRSPSSFKPVNTTQAQKNDVQVIDDIGPTSDGSTVVQVVNSIPRPMVFKANGKETRIDACSTCKIYKNSGEVPTDIYDRGTKAAIVVAPGKNLVHWYHQGGNISEIYAQWNLKPGRKYSVAMILDLSEGRSNWDTSK